MIKPSKNAHLHSDLLKKVDEMEPENEVSAQVNSSFCLKNKIATFTKSSRGTSNNEPCSFARSAAFTLAEVLVTLGIIGVVAAMTMPTLMEHHKKQVTVTSLQKMYSTLMNAAMMYQAENDLTFDEFDTSLDDKTFMQTYMLPYLDTIQECSSLNFCYGSKLPLAIDRKTKIKTGSLWVLKNGSFLGAYKNSGGILFYFDINGAKGPNWSGRDIFYYFLINKNKISNYRGCDTIIRTLQSGIYPGAYSTCFRPFSKYDREKLLGTSLDRTCNHNAPKVTDDAGDACAALIMQDGWKISDDYPW